MKKNLLLTSFLLCALALSAQVPANDLCDDAIAVTTDQVVMFSTIDAGTDGPFHPGCTSATNDTIFADIWYSYTASFTGTADWTLCNTADYDTKIAVYNAGANCPLTDGDLLDCNDDFGTCGNSTSRILFDVVQGETYILRLGGWGETAPGLMGSGSFVVEEFVSAVANDFCQFAIPISLGENQMLSNVGATTDGPDHPNNAGCFGFGDMTVQADIWYSFTAPSTTTVEWSTCDQVNFDSRLAVYSAGATCPLSDGDLWACNDDGNGCDNYTSKVIFDVVQGETYLMRLGGWNGDQGVGTFDLVETVPPVPPANDLCTNADSAWIVTAMQADDFDNPVVGTTVNGTFPTDGSFIYPNVQCFNFSVTSGEFSTVWYHFNTNGNEELGMKLYKAAGAESASFFLDMFDDCGTPVDTNVIGGSCIYVDEVTAFGETLVSNLPAAPTDYLIRITTRLTTQLPGDFFFFIIGTPPLSAGEAFPGSFEVFPNPASGQLNLNLHVTEAANTNFRVLNTLGQTVSSKAAGVLPIGQHSFQFGLEGLSRGVYFLAIQSERGTSMVKFVKE